MTEYLIAFNDEWVPDLTEEDSRGASRRVSALRAEMKAAGVLIFTGGLDDEARCSTWTPPAAPRSSPTVRSSRPRSTSAASPS